MQQRIRLGRLPKAFEGFRIVQLSDLHISPFMSAEEIRRYVAIANQLKGDLVVLTGDFLTYDPSAEGAVVQALSALKAHLAFSAASATMRFTLRLRIPSRVSSRLAGLASSAWTMRRSIRAAACSI
jgi:3',5'-cyclic AMP phosphodiesterase CpdA